jgi:hypothetical protein
MMHDIDPALPASLRTVDPSALEEPDRYLMWGLLVDAAESLVLGATDPWRDDEVLATEIRDWVVADDPAWPFSFVNACAALGLSPVQLRSELGPWLASASVRPAN